MQVSPPWSLWFTFLRQLTDIYIYVTRLDSLSHHTRIYTHSFTMKLSDDKKDVDVSSTSIWGTKIAERWMRYKIYNILNDGFYNVHLCALPLPLLLLCDLKDCIRTVLPKAAQHPVLRPFASSSQFVQPCIVYLTFFPLLPLLFSRLPILGSIFLLVALSKTNRCALSLVWTVTVRK